MIHYQTWPSTGISCFWLANLKKSPPLKLLGQINRNMAGSIYGMSSMKLLILSWSVNKHGHHRKFLFLIGRYLKILLWNCLAKMNRNLVGSIYMYRTEGCVLSFLKADWKVCDTGSTHWASSLLLIFLLYSWLDYTNLLQEFTKRITIFASISVNTPGTTL